MRTNRQHILSLNEESGKAEEEHAVRDDDGGEEVCDPRENTPTTTTDHDDGNFVPRARGNDSDRGGVGESRRQTSSF